MAHGFGAFAVSDAHVTLLHQHPGWVHDYLEGIRPGGEAASSLPADWPEEPLESLGSWSINHRNTDLYHWILNGGPDPVAGAGAIFQTWHAPEHPSTALKLDDTNERFGFHADQLAELAALVKAVDVDHVQRAFCDWLTRQGKDATDIDQYACEPFVDEFRTFSQGLELAIERGEGLIW
jgi:hypothetical protein